MLWPSAFAASRASRPAEARSVAHHHHHRLQMADIESKVKNIIVDQLSVSEEQVTSEARFTEDLGADSLDVVELVMQLEEEFEIEVSDEEAEKLQTVGAVVDYIRKKSEDA